VHNDEKAQERTRRWREWEAKFWTAINATLGGDGPTGAARRYGDIWVMLDFFDNDGLIQLSVVDASLPALGGTMPGFSHKVYWDKVDAGAAAEKVMELVAKVRADPIHRLIHKKPQA
jgi:hypothetical protein